MKSFLFTPLHLRSPQSLFIQPVLHRSPPFTPIPSPARLLFSKLAPMRVLYAVFVLSMAALVWIIVALTRYIRNHDARPGNPLRLSSNSGDESLKNTD